VPGSRDRSDASPQSASATLPEAGQRSRTWPAALTLYFTAALIPESIATYNSPPLLLATRPLILLFISAFYGSVALLVREFMRRRQARWTSVLMLGMAAGCVNEGVIAGTWYKVQYSGYALTGGVDPAVAVGLTVFHALYSTVLPVLLVNLMFPTVADRPWLGRRGLTICPVLLALTAAAGFGPAAHRGMKAVVLVIVAALVVTALALPDAPARVVRVVAVPGVGRLRLAGAAGTVAFFVAFAIIPGIVGSAVPAARLAGWQVFLIIGMIAFFWAVVATGRNWTGRAGWGDRQTLAVITGGLMPTIIGSMLIPVALVGLEPVVTLPMLALLVWLAKRYRPAS
jgi:hypothetical protein